ncbi:hypothetical protein [Bradyrhizobium sp. S3.9.1]|uniref:hypothetical protein n=1 Tax=Bradyrhizobium sp. S3.9.1 TaxID=3156431 RepID=UPI00339A8638
MPPKAEVGYPARRGRNDADDRDSRAHRQVFPSTRPRKPATVSASALALHLDCTRTYVGKLEAEGVIQRQRGGFPLDQSRVAYLRYLRRERRQSARSEADADHVKVKTEMLQLRLME